MIRASQAETLAAIYYLILDGDPSTRTGIACYLTIDPVAVSHRLRVLHRAKLIEPSGTLDVEGQGKNPRVWRLTNAGLAAWEERDA